MHAQAFVYFLFWKNNIIAMKDFEMQSNKMALQVCLMWIRKLKRIILNNPLFSKTMQQQRNIK